MSRKKKAKPSPPRQIVKVDPFAGLPAPDPAQSPSARIARQMIGRANRELQAKARVPLSRRLTRQETERAQDLEAVGLQGEGATLASADAIHIDRESQANTIRARRLDAFHALKDGMAVGAFDAARRLEKDTAISLGLADNGQAGPRVDNGRKTGREDDMIAALGRVEAVLALIGARDAWLLTWLISPPANRFDHWRGIVAHVTGEENRDCQGAAVRLACGNLVEAYRQIDRLAA